MLRDEDSQDGVIGHNAQFNHKCSICIEFAVEWALKGLPEISRNAQEWALGGKILVASCRNNLILDCVYVSHVMIMMQWGPLSHHNNYKHYESS